MSRPMTHDSPGAPRGALLRRLKATAQLLEPTVFLGKAGLSAEFRRTVDAELTLRELVKVKFVAFKDQKKELATELATATGSHLIMRVGHVAVLYRTHPEPAKRRFET